MSKDNPHRIADPGHVHPIRQLTPEESAAAQKEHGFDMSEHLAALPANIRDDYVRAVNRSAPCPKSK
jgi:hypothetical protein